MTCNEIISPVPRVLIFISHSHLLLNLTKGYGVWQESCNSLLLLWDNRSGAWKTRTMLTSQRILYKLHSRRLDFMGANPICVLLCVSHSSQAPATITPATFFFLSFSFSIQAQGHAAELQADQAVHWDFKCNRSHAFMYMSALNYYLNGFASNTVSWLSVPIGLKGNLFQNILIHGKRIIKCVNLLSWFMVKAAKEILSIPAEWNFHFLSNLRIFPHSQGAGRTRAAFLAQCSPVSGSERSTHSLEHKSGHPWSVPRHSLGFIKSPLHLSDTRWTLP